MAEPRDESYIFQVGLEPDDLVTQLNVLEANFKKAGKRGSFIEKANQRALNFVKDRAFQNLNNKITSHRRPGKDLGTVRQFRSGLMRTVIFNKKSHEVSPDGFRFMVVDQVRAIMGKDRDYAFSLEYGDDSQVGKYRYFLFLGRRPFPSGLPAGASRRAQDRAAAANPNFNNREDSTRRGQFQFSHRPSKLRSNHPVFGVGAQPASSNYVTDRIVGKRELATGGKANGQFPQGTPLKAPYLSGPNAKRFRVRIQNPVPEYRYGRDAGEQFVAQGQYYNGLQKFYTDQFPVEQDRPAMEPGPKVKNKKARNKKKVDPLKGKANKGTVPNSDVTVTKINP